LIVGTTVTSRPMTLTFGVTTGNQHICRMPQRAQEALRRSSGDRFFEFLQK
jgi:hypothetical protein